MSPRPSFNSEAQSLLTSLFQDPSLWLSSRTRFSTSSTLLKMISNSFTKRLLLTSSTSIVTFLPKSSSVVFANPSRGSSVTLQPSTVSSLKKVALNVTNPTLHLSETLSDDHDYTAIFIANYSF